MISFNKFFLNQIRSLLRFLKPAFFRNLTLLERVCLKSTGLEILKNTYFLWVNFREWYMYGVFKNLFLLFSIEIYRCA